MWSGLEVGCLCVGRGSAWGEEARARKEIDGCARYSYTATKSRTLTANVRPKAQPGVRMLLLDEE